MRKMHIILQYLVMERMIIAWIIFWRGEVQVLEFMRKYAQ